VFKEKIFENLQKLRLWEYFPPQFKNNIKNRNKRKRKGKERERKVTYSLFTLYLI